MRNFGTALNVILLRVTVANKALHYMWDKKIEEFLVQFFKEPLHRGKPLQPRSFQLHRIITGS